MNFSNISSGPGFQVESEDGEIGVAWAGSCEGQERLEKIMSS